MGSTSILAMEQWFQLILTKDKKISLTKQLYQYLRQRILAKEFLAGTRLPASRALAKHLVLSRNTVQATYDQLIAEGYLTTKLGSGTYVAANIPDEYTKANPLKKQRTNSRVIKPSTPFAKACHAKC